MLSRLGARFSCLALPSAVVDGKGDTLGDGRVLFCNAGCSSGAEPFGAPWGSIGVGWSGGGVSGGLLLITSMGMVPGAPKAVAHWGAGWSLAA